ncbi:ROK family protein [Falsibacillus albus]|uniref:ROK family protein n=1 Tax=Falsibacillus albus TaxID=2478915 RepID=A0A3L7K0J2_9BACI|nr:BadF/BadG/BcrA/BcrD ATPase family protein [Falsibacillus albus]RLQ96587.1 ROK family protein [Falsibacillus albus]
MELVIGVDAGGTKTTALILNQDEDILFEAKSGIGNPAVDFPQALQNIKKVLIDCLQSRFGAECKAVAAGIAGIEAGNYKDLMYTELRKEFSIPILLMNDAELAHFSLLKGSDGVVTIAGTGSVSFGRNGKKEGYTGGWGHLLGDEGSSYHIAMEACRQIAICADKGIPFTDLSESIMRVLQLKEANDLKGFVYQSTKDQIAALSTHIYEMALKGNEHANSLFQQAGIQLAQQTYFLLKKLDFQREKVLVSIKGSLLEKNEFVQGEFKKQLEMLYEGSKWAPSESSPAAGAIYAWQMAKGTDRWKRSSLD